MLRLVMFAWVCLTPVTALAATGQPVEYGTLLVRTAVTLGGVCLLAAASMRWVLPRVMGLAASDKAPMRVLARLQLEPRRSLLVVRVGQHALLLSTSEAGVQLLRELESHEAVVFERGEPVAVSDLLRLRPDVSRETSGAES